jgi:hypothetical protein
MSTVSMPNLLRVHEYNRLSSVRETNLLVMRCDDFVRFLRRANQRVRNVKMRLWSWRTLHCDCGCCLYVVVFAVQHEPYLSPII